MINSKIMSDHLLGATIALCRSSRIASSRLHEAMATGCPAKVEDLLKRVVAAMVSPELPSPAIGAELADLARYLQELAKHNMVVHVVEDECCLTPPEGRLVYAPKGQIYADAASALADCVAALEIIWDLQRANNVILVS